MHTCDTHTTRTLHTVVTTFETTRISHRRTASYTPCSRCKKLARLAYARVWEDAYAMKATPPLDFFIVFFFLGITHLNVLGLRREPRAHGFLHDLDALW